MRFDAYPQRQFVTESTNINSLAGHHIWSTIKTLPATLPEPSSMVHGSRTTDHGSQTGVTGAVSHSYLDIGQGVGRLKETNHKTWFLSIFEQRDVFCFIGFRLTKKHASRTVR